MQKTRIVQIRSKLANFPNFLRLVRQDGEQMSGKKATQGFFTLFTFVVQKKFCQTCFQTVFRDVSFQRFIQTLYYSRMQEFTTK